LKYILKFSTNIHVIHLGFHVMPIGMRLPRPWSNPPTQKRSIGSSQTLKSQKFRPFGFAAQLFTNHPVSRQQSERPVPSESKEFIPELQVSPFDNSRAKSLLKAPSRSRY
jgi:hypothetical protein